MCRLSVEGNHRKRKRFHGHSCDTARLVLCSVSSVALNYVELRDPNALLCLSCDKLLRNLQAAETNVKNLHQQVSEKLQQIQRAGHGNDDIPSKKQRIGCESHASTLNQEFSNELTEPNITEQKADLSPINCLAESGLGNMEQTQEFVEIEQIIGSSSISDLGQSDNTRQSEESNVTVAQQVTESMLSGSSVDQDTMEFSEGLLESMQQNLILRPSPPLKVSSRCIHIISVYIVHF